MNSNKSEKSRGVVVFAFNSENVNYVKIANQTSLLIEKNLKLPITLITDSTEHIEFDYDRVVVVENKHDNFRYSQHNEIVQWRNLDRYKVYELSPYYETLLLDTDYLVLDNTLNKIWLQDFDYRIMEESFTPNGVFNRTMGIASHNWLWATVVFFKKTKHTELLFEMINRVQKNYRYYKSLYKLEGNYRNDFAFSIADLVLNGYTTDKTRYLPYRMFTIEDHVANIEYSNNQLLIRQKDRVVISPLQNVHVMDKEFLQSENFKRFINDVTA